MSAGEVRAMLTAGQKVDVRQDGVFQYTGEVVRYTRNDSFEVLDPGTQTVCDYHYKDLTPAQAGEAGPQ
jgi:hypothetical protein